MKKVEWKKTERENILVSVKGEMAQIVATVNGEYSSLRIRNGPLLVRLPR